MSETPPESPPPASPPSPPPTQVHRDTDFVSDLIFWKRKHHSILLLLVATATWVVMEVYQFNFITVVSWVAMAIVTGLFAWGNINRLFKKHTPDLSRISISDQSAVKTAIVLRQYIEEGVKLLFHVSVEREWFVSAATVAVLYVLSKVASCLDLITFCYIGLVAAMIVPIMYTKYEHKIREYSEILKMKFQRLQSVVEEKHRTMKNKMAEKKKEMKEKKME